MKEVNNMGSSQSSYSALTESKLTVGQVNAELQYSDIDVKDISVFNKSGDSEPPRAITFIVHPPPKLENSILNELNEHFPPVLSKIVFSFVPECIHKNNGLEFLDGILFKIDSHLERFSRVEVCPQNPHEEENVEIIGVIHLFMEPSSVI